MRRAFYVTFRGVAFTRTRGRLSILTVANLEGRSQGTTRITNSNVLLSYQGDRYFLNTIPRHEVIGRARPLISQTINRAKEVSDGVATLKIAHTADMQQMCEDIRRARLDQESIFLAPPPLSPTPVAPVSTGVQVSNPPPPTVEQVAQEAWSVFSGRWISLCSAPAWAKVIGPVSLNALCMGVNALAGSYLLGVVLELSEMIEVSDSEGTSTSIANHILAFTEKVDEILKSSIDRLGLLDSSSLSTDISDFLVQNLPGKLAFLTAYSLGQLALQMTASTVLRITARQITLELAQALFDATDRNMEHFVYDPKFAQDSSGDYDSYMTREVTGEKKLLDEIEEEKEEK